MININLIMVPVGTEYIGINKVCNTHLVLLLHKGGKLCHSRNLEILDNSDDERSFLNA